MTDNNKVNIITLDRLNKKVCTKWVGIQIPNKYRNYYGNSKIVYGLDKGKVLYT